MSVLPPSFLGKKVFLDGDNQRHYILKYEELSGKRKIHALLFDQETPVIFAVLDYNGRFLDSFYLSNKTTVESTDILERYKKIAERKKQYKVTQDDLKDALRPKEEAKMKNKNIMKLLTDELLEDIKHQWPSRLIALQNADGKSDQSLIMIALKDALEQANALKSFHYLLHHRLDSYIPMLAEYIQDHPQLIEEVPEYYLSFNHARIVEEFLFNAVKHVEIDNSDLIEKILQQAQKIDHVHYSTVLRQLLVKLFRRAKGETDDSSKQWLNKTVHDQSLRSTIVEILKK
ncbi:hypothetical protein CR194_16370 [Salipaludibacillus keqinensis]|uniref:Uncharacterized protein n=1 Tax=Salipaludibacillus keqinensis TaxID=2045207 RepID=A0A323T9T9_9BACI|nr:hypothetical protein [Salipaludibacillus keqinensis]PYZ92402.1 hypothetical protein CR194_16370 [Salipaludibacillus keqinensis]